MSKSQMAQDLGRDLQQSMGGDRTSWDRLTTAYEAAKKERTP